MNNSELPYIKTTKIQRHNDAVITARENKKRAKKFNLTEADKQMISYVDHLAGFVARENIRFAVKYRLNMQLVRSIYNAKYAEVQSEKR